MTYVFLHVCVCDTDDTQQPIGVTEQSSFNVLPDNCQPVFRDTAELPPPSNADVNCDIPLNNSTPHLTSSSSFTHLIRQKSSDDFETDFRSPFDRRTHSAVWLSNDCYQSNSSSCDELVFDKLPNYLTALSIPAHATAGCVARSSSDLVTQFIEHHDRQRAQEQSDWNVLDKVPAYQSSFTNSTRYDESAVVFESGPQPELDSSQTLFRDDVFRSSIEELSSDGRNERLRAAMAENSTKHVCVDD